jgi:methylmalonyl-CoA carboxyltransferase 12S subunit
MSSSTNNTEIAKLAETIESLCGEVARLGERTTALERALSAPTQIDHRETPQNRAVSSIDEEMILAISAAIAAYLGVKPRIRQIVLVQSHPWSQQGRVTIQASRELVIHHG